ncbi:hypothetical protein SSAG_00904 [Streptomyces sp. Mg1]|nr:hypothetical protein SSAG_00904 [Streptomyces sp. Mg1]
MGRVLATGEAYTRPAHHKKGTKPRRLEGRTSSLSGLRSLWRFTG